MTAAIVLAIVFWVMILGTIAGVVWRARGGHPAVGFAIGAVFGLFGIVYCCFATPLGRWAGEPASAAGYVPFVPVELPRAGMTPAWWGAVGLSILTIAALLVFATPHIPGN